MKTLKNQLAAGILLAGLTVSPGSVMAESNSASGASPSAAVNLDFRVVIPAILRFQVGNAGSGNINTILFEPDVATLGDDSDVTATSGGDLGPGSVTVSLLSNAGQITITEENNSGGAGLDNGDPNETIPYSEILTDSTDNTNFPAPVLSDSDNNTSSVAPTSGNNKVTNRTVAWTYTYDNTDVYPAGDYGTSANGGRVTYTAAAP
jgi:hypothetical protein